MILMIQSWFLCNTECRDSFSFCTIFSFWTWRGKGWRWANRDPRRVKGQDDHNDKHLCVSSASHWHLINRLKYILSKSVYPCAWSEMRRGGRVERYHPLASHRRRTSPLFMILPAYVCERVCARVSVLQYWTRTTRQHRTHKTKHSGAHAPHSHTVPAPYIHPETEVLPSHAHLSQTRTQIYHKFLFFLQITLLARQRQESFCLASLQEGWLGTDTHTYTHTNTYSLSLSLSLSLTHTHTYTPARKHTHKYTQRDRNLWKCLSAAWRQDMPANYPISPSQRLHLQHIHT